MDLALDARPSRDHAGVRARLGAQAVLGPRVGAAALGFVALAVVAIGWLQNPHCITASEAVSAARHGLAASGLRDAEVDDRPEAGVYRRSAEERIAVWKTAAMLDGGAVQLWVARADGELVFLDDRAPDGASHLLTEAQFQRLAGYYEHPAASRQIRRNVALTVAGVLVALLSAYHAATGDRRAPAGRPTVRRQQPTPTPPRRTRPLRASQEHS